MVFVQAAAAFRIKRAMNIAVKESTMSSRKSIIRTKAESTDPDTRKSAVRHWQAVEFLQ
jgi:hypothetical protein